MSGDASGRFNLSKLLPVLKNLDLGQGSSFSSAVLAARCIGEIGLGWQYAPAEARAASRDVAVYSDNDDTRLHSIVSELKKCGSNEGESEGRGGVKRGGEVEVERESVCVCVCVRVCECARV